MYRMRAPKDKALKVPYISYYPHTKDRSDQHWNQGYYRVVSIDPCGRNGRNLGLRIETRPGPGNTGLIRGEVFQHISLPKDEDAEDAVLCQVYDNLTKILDQHLDFFLKSHIIIIERQLPDNYWGIRTSQHIISYFLIKLKDAPLLPIILEIDSRLKLRQLGIRSGLPKTEYKKLLIEKAIELLTMRADKTSLQLLTSSKKKDDIADTICQIEAVFSYFNWPLSQPCVTLTIHPPDSSDSPEN